MKSRHLKKHEQEYLSLPDLEAERTELWAQRCLPIGPSERQNGRHEMWAQPGSKVAAHFHSKKKFHLHYYQFCRDTCEIVKD